MKRYIDLLCIFAGAGIGGISRHLLVYFINKPNAAFAFGTISVNIIGCFIAGLFLFFIQQHDLSQPMALLFVTGLLGGFTTFSAFSMETVVYLQNGQVMTAVYNILLSLSGIIFAYAGYLLAKVL